MPFVPCRHMKTMRTFFTLTVAQYIYQKEALFSQAPYINMYFEITSEWTDLYTVILQCFNWCTGNPFNSFCWNICKFNVAKKYKCRLLPCLALQQIHNYTRTIAEIWKLWGHFFHCTLLSQKEALEINRFSDNSWMNWTFLYIGQEKTKVVGGRLVTVPAHKICTVTKLSKFVQKFWSYVYEGSV